MSLNWKEISLILSEADLVGSKIQSVVQSSFHSVTWKLYNKNRGRFDFYSEVGTQNSRLHLLSGERPVSKTKKLQRFEQFARKNIEGSVIVSCIQLPFDRVVVWDLINHDRKLKIYIRLYSGNGANIIITDEEDTILDLLLRRPGRDETSGEKLVIEKRDQDPGNFEIRPFEGSFNSFIEKTCVEVQDKSLLEQLRKSVTTLMEHEKDRLMASIRSSQRTLSENSNYEELKYEADLLSAHSYLIHKGDPSITVPDYSRNCSVTLSINRALSPGDNVSEYYERYQKAKGAFENATEEQERLKDKLRDLETRFERILTPSEDQDTDIRRLKAFLDKTSTPQKTELETGLRCSSKGFELLIGRNAKENDELLRRYAKGNDLWFHTRDFPGGYVFVKFKRDRTVPLEVMLDAANLAVLFSKAKTSGKVDLYYTQVKYLRRVKDGKTGLVLPTQEKNLTIEPDPERAKHLLEQ